MHEVEAMIRVYNDRASTQLNTERSFLEKQNQSQQAFRRLESRVFKDLSKDVKRKMFTNKATSEVIVDIRDSDRTWENDAANGFLSYSKMVHVIN